jgi:predicted lipid carrier protein YhbT
MEHATSERLITCATCLSFRADHQPGRWHCQRVQDIRLPWVIKPCSLAVCLQQAAVAERVGENFSWTLALAYSRHQCDLYAENDTT